MKPPQEKVISEVSAHKPSPMFDSKHNINSKKSKSEIYVPFHVTSNQEE